jgi:hypothetical protein
VARELVLNTAQHFNWVNIAGAINHPEKGKRFDYLSRYKYKHRFN